MCKKYAINISNLQKICTNNAQIMQTTSKCQKYAKTFIILTRYAKII